MFRLDYPTKQVAQYKEKVRQGEYLPQFVRQKSATMLSVFSCSIEFDEILRIYDEW